MNGFELLTFALRVRPIDARRDPREVKAKTIAADVTNRTADLGKVLTVAEVWPPCGLDAAEAGEHRSGRLAEPWAPHAGVLAEAGIPHVSTNRLHRTFSLLGEAAGAPARAIAQVMGHTPSAIAEG